MRYPVSLYPAMFEGEHIWVAECEVLSLHASGNTPFLALLDLEEKEKNFLQKLTAQGLPYPDIPTRSLPLIQEEAAAKAPSKQFTIYTDGACSGNPGPGGWAYIMLDEQGAEYAASGFEADTTNNRMEMMAALMAIRALPPNASAILFSDSNYVISTMRGKFAKKKNLDLWKLLDDAVIGHDITYNWVKGHDGDQYNERCNDMAVAQYKGAVS